MSARGAGPAGWQLRRLLRGMGGARVVYGKPVHAGERTIVPVARLRVRGGFGFGSGPQADAERNDELSGGDGAGGGGTFDAQPVGFIESGPQGTRFQPIHLSGRAGRIAAAATAGALAGAAVTGAAIGGRAAARAARTLGRVGLRRLPGAAGRSPRRWLRR